MRGKAKAPAKRPGPFLSLAAAAVVLLLALLLAEGALRAAGALYRTWRLPRRGGAGAVVLCVGDSNTFGVGAPKGRSYPERLQARLDAACGPGRYRVLNEGVPGENSSRLASRLPGLLARHEPAALVVLTGLNNSAQSGGPLPLFDPDAGALPRAVAELELRMRASRLYELARVALGPRAAPPVPRRPCAASAEPFLAGADRDMADGRYARVEAQARRALELAPDCAHARVRLGDALFKQGDAAGGYREGLAGRRLEPTHPQVRDLPDPDRVIRDRARLNVALDRLLRYDLTRIALTARARGATLIVSGYPWSDNRRDPIRWEVARQQGAGTVDLRAAFAGAPPGNYCAYDEPGSCGHPNAAGYEWMARAVEDALRASGVATCGPGRQ